MSELPVNPVLNPAILDQYSEENPITLMEDRAQARIDLNNTLWRKVRPYPDYRHVPRSPNKIS